MEKEKEGGREVTIEEGESVLGSTSCILGIDTNRS